MNFMTRHKKLIKVIIAMLICLTVFNFLCPFAKAANTVDENTLVEISEEEFNPRTVADGILGVLLMGDRIALTVLGKGIDFFMAAFNHYEPLDVSTILFNHVELTDINFFDVDGTTNDMIKTLRTSIANWYLGIRNVAAALLIIICIYVGIRLALALTGEEKAKYKQMLIDWITSVALLFILHYAMILIITINNAVVKGIENGIITSSGDKTINDLSERFLINAWVTPDGFQISYMAGTTNAVLYLMIKIMTIVFLIMYIKRMVTVGFLIIIAPLVTITYSIDKISDGKAQGMNAWFKEFSYNVLIQPFQCIIFAALATIANTLANITTGSVTSGFMALFLLIFIFEAEKLIKHIFHIQSSSLGDAIASAALAASIAQKSMAFGEQVKGKVEKKIASSNKTRPEFKKQQQENKYRKLKEANKHKQAEKYKNRINKRAAKERKRKLKLQNRTKGQKIAAAIGRGTYRVVAGANNIAFKAATGFAIAGAMGQDEVAVGTAINQSFKAGKQNLEKEQAYYAGAQKHKIASAYNDLKDQELQNIATEYYASGRGEGKTETQQAEEIDKIFNDKVMDMLTGAEVATTAGQNKLLSCMKDYGIFLAAQGKNRDEQFAELESIIDGIDSGNIGEIWSGEGGFGVIPTYHLGEINKGSGRSHKLIIKETIERAGNNKAAAFSVDENAGGVIRQDINKREEELSRDIDFDAIDADIERRRRGEE